MDDATRATLWSQFDAAIDMLDNAIMACPDTLWGERERRPEYWYLVYHTLFFLDYYLDESPEQFRPPAPYTLGELEPDVMPDRVYTRDEMRAYLAHGRAKCRAVIAGLDPARAGRRYANGRLDLPFVELLLYSLRHVQHHAAQLNLILRQTVNSAPTWVGRTKHPLGDG
jgi:DinB family protein